MLDAEKAVEFTLSKFGRLDILVNSAAGNFLAPAETLTPKGFKTGNYVPSVLHLCKLVSVVLGITFLSLVCVLGISYAMACNWNNPGSSSMTQPI